MAKIKEVVIGTSDLVGATVVSVDWDTVTFERDGRTFRLELEYESWYDTCMCEGPCYCSHSSESAYFVARELI